MDIKEIFWTNVFWHIDNKGLDPLMVIGINHRMARKFELNATLDTVAKIACMLHIDDYAILFEEVV